MTLIVSVLRPNSPLFPVALALLTLAGCSTLRFSGGYCIDPKPPQASYADLVSPANPQPVYLVFDMYSAEGSFPEATRKIGPRLVRILKLSGLFSSVANFGSENIALILISMRETAVATRQDDTKSLPPGLASGLVGSRGAVAYSFTTYYQAPGRNAFRKVYPHAIHVVDGGSPWLGGALPTTGTHAVDMMVEQVILNFLKDLQKEHML